MLRRSTRCMMGEHYEALVIGGGAAGCNIASRLAAANLKTHVIERGPDIRKGPSWHAKMPAAKVLHRLSKRYEKLIPTTAPEGSSAGAAVSIPCPNVLGGMSIMGSRTWIRGTTKEDLASLPFEAEEMVRMYRRFENVESEHTSHRGTHGKFFLFRSQSTSPFYRPFGEAASSLRVPLIGDFNKDGGVLTEGCGRPESLIDPFGLRAANVLSCCLEPALATKRPLTFECDSRAVSLTVDGGRIQGVEVEGPGGKKSISGNIVILCAGAIGNAQLLLNPNSKLPAEAQQAKIGTGFWDVPSVTLQYESLEQNSMNVMRGQLPQLLEWLRWSRKKRGFAASSYDDYLLLSASKGHVAPNMRTMLQPFLMTSDAQSVDKDGFQCVMQLMQPKSRGVVTADTVEPNYYGQKEDLDAMEETQGLVERIVGHQMMNGVRSRESQGKPFAIVRGSQGINGGSCAFGRVVDPETFLVKGFSNCYVGDSSALPSPLIGDVFPTVLSTSELLADTLLRLR